MKKGKKVPMQQLPSKELPLNGRNHRISVLLMIIQALSMKRVKKTCSQG